MAIDPGKLAAFAQGGKKDGGGGPPGKPGGGGPPHGGGGGKGGDHHDGGEGHEEEGEEAEEGGDERFAKLIPLLEKHHEDIEACCDELDPETLKDTGSEMSPEDKQILLEGFEDLDHELVAEAKEALGGGISMDEAHDLAGHLESEDLVEDPDRVAGWLFRVAQVSDEAEEGGEGEGEEGSKPEHEKPEPDEEPAD